MKGFISILFILTLNLNTYFVNTIKFEELLGKHLSYVEKTVGSNFRKNDFEKVKISLYSSQNFNMDFHGIFSYFISVETDKNDIVKAITIHFGEVINRQFYDSFIENYGEPNHIYVMSNIKVISETSPHETDDPFHRNLTKREGDLIEGTFEDKPLFMIWEKDGFYIQAFLRHKQNISEIMFSLESPPFNVKSNKKN